jgi:hypothetical protein
MFRRERTPLLLRWGAVSQSPAWPVNNGLPPIIYWRTLVTISRLENLALAKGWCGANERSLGMQDVEIDDLRRKIERYENLLRNVGNERTRREIEQMREDAEQRLEEIEKRS